jgi:hypothetical protein
VAGGGRQLLNQRMEEQLPPALKARLQTDPAAQARRLVVFARL